MAHKLTQEEAKAAAIIIGVIFVVILLSIVVSKFFKTGSYILEKIGAKADKATQDAAKKIDIALDKVNSEGVKNYWNPGFYKVNQPNYLQSASIKKFCEDLAKQIYDGIGTFTDNPTMILAAFKKMNSKSGVSAVADLFQIKYNYDLFEFLHSRLDIPEQIKVMGQIISYTQNLPIKS